MMKGTLYKTADVPGCWSVLFWEDNPYFRGGPGEIRQAVSELQVSPASLHDPELSAYWADGREVDFRRDESGHAAILPDSYNISVGSVSDFRKELVKMIEKVRYGLDGYGAMTSTEIAAEFEKKINAK